MSNTRYFFHVNIHLQENVSRFPRLSSNNQMIEAHYGVIVVGSGYGASIAASRCSRAGQKVCVLERGKEWLPGSFPESASDAGENFQINYQGNPNIVGNENFMEFL